MSIITQRVLFVLMIIACIILFVACVSYIMSFFVIDVTNYTVSSIKIPKEFDGFKILQLSDLHNYSFGKNNKKILKIIEKQSPDIIVFTGDMVNTNSKNYNNFYNLAKNLAKNYPTYYIMGNHELKLSGKEQLQMILKLKSLGINVLNNSEAAIAQGGELIYLHGLHQPVLTYKNNFKNNDYYDFTLAQMTQLLHSPNPNYFNVLLAHSPFDFEIFANWGADLVLSGHVHGGLIRAPFIGGILSPERALFPKYSAGEYNIGDSKMLVSRGLGNGTINLRILNNPEICVIELKSLSQN